MDADPLETVKEDASDAEDVPSDFFDDFNKEEFMEGLQVIDSWDDTDKKRRPPRIDAEAVDSVQDLRELIEGREDERAAHHGRSHYKETEYERVSEERLDDYIKPGSRRDPNKTKEAIKRDKEVKVKEYLAKSLDATDELKPPGTELDDFYEENKSAKSSVMVSEEGPPPKKKPTRSKEQHSSPVRHQRRSPRRSPARHSPHRSPRPSARWSPRRNQRHSSPVFRKYQHNKPRWQQIHQILPHYMSPRRMSPRRSPRRSPHRSPRRSPHRSPRRSPRRRHSRSPMPRRHSRSPPPRRYARRSRSKSPNDNFLYPRDSKPDYPHRFDIPDPRLAHIPYPGDMPSYQYPHQLPDIPPGYTGPPVEFIGQPGMPPGAPGMSFMPLAPVPQPVPAPMMNTGPMMNSDSMMNPDPMRIPGPLINPVAPPAMVPAPQMGPPEKLPPIPNPIKDVTKPYDALAQLVAEGKISREDYLKLAPTKVTSMDTGKRVMVLNRCSTALNKLATLLLPNRLVMNNNMVGPEPKCLVSKYCSPLKRQGAVEFHFTKMSGRATAQQNKQLVDSIISSLGLEKVVSRPKTKPKNMKDAACQTSKPYCDVCEIRECVKMYDGSTSIDAEFFSSTVHTQVVEQDLMSSKAVFAPSGSLADGAPISIAHMTPAQLVSQLAARAKTLKQSEPMPPNQYMRRNPNSYDPQYQNNYNYRY